MYSPPSMGLWAEWRQEVITYPIACGKRRLVQLLAVFRLGGGFVIGWRRYLQSGPDDGRRGRFRRYGWRAGDGRAYDGGGQRDDGHHSPATRHRPRRSVRHRQPPATGSCGCCGHRGARQGITSGRSLPRSVLMYHMRRADAELQQDRKLSRYGDRQWLRKNNEYCAGDVWQNDRCCASYWTVKNRTTAAPIIAPWFFSLYSRLLVVYSSTSSVLLMRPVTPRYGRVLPNIRSVETKKATTAAIEIPPPRRRRRERPRRRLSRTYLILYERNV